MDISKAVRSVQVLNIDDEESTITSDEVLLHDSDPNPAHFIISDADEELLIMIRFKDSIDIQSIKLYALPLNDDMKIEDASPPKQVYIFKLSNLDQDFEDIKRLKPHKSIICSSTKLSNGQHVNLRKKISKPLAFKKVKYLAIFIESNQHDTEYTYLHGISLNVKSASLPQRKSTESKSVRNSSTKQDVPETTAPTSSMNKFADHMNELWDIDECDRRKGIKLLEKICSNIMSDPSNLKFRDLNFAKIGERLEQCQPALLLLFAAGFNLSADGERLQLESNESNIKNIRAVQEAIRESQISSSIDSTVNKLCYCSQRLYAKLDNRRIAGWQCRCCQKHIRDIVYYSCGTRPCLYIQVTGASNLVCSECYNIMVPEEVIKSDLYSGGGYDERSALIHRKVMVSLHRIS